MVKANGRTIMSLFMEKSSSLVTQSVSGCRDLLKLTHDRTDMAVRKTLLMFLVWGGMCCCRMGLPWALSEGQGRMAPAARARGRGWAAPAVFRALGQPRACATCQGQLSACLGLPMDGGWKL